MLSDRHQRSLSMRFPEKSSRWFVAALAAVLLITLEGCLLGPHVRRTDRTSSVVDFLYPRDANALAEVGLPVLRLPLRVGVAFVPQSGGGTGGAAFAAGAAVSDMQKSKLLKRVADSEREILKTVQSIVMAQAVTSKAS